MNGQDSPSTPSSNQAPVGDRLREARIEQGLSLEEVAEATRISLSNLRALEAMAYDQLPADTFVKGHIALYCAHLGIDSQAMVEQFLQQRHGDSKEWRAARHHISEYALTPKRLAEPSHVSSAAIALILFLLIVLSLGAFCFYTSWNPFSFLTGATHGLSSSVMASFHPADPATATGAHRKALSLDAHFLKDTPVHVTLDDQTWQQTFAKETTVRWEAAKHIRLEFMQPDSASLQLNGAPLPFPQNANGHFILQVPAPSAQQ
jgi:transcriptional regulator with XRE-family HTH domain